MSMLPVILALELEFHMQFEFGFTMIRSATYTCVGESRPNEFEVSKKDLLEAS